MASAAVLNLFESKIAPLDPPSPKPHPITKHEVDRTTGCGDGYLKFLQHGGGRHLGFVRTVNSAIQSADPETPTLRVGGLNGAISIKSKMVAGRHLGKFECPYLRNG